MILRCVCWSIFLCLALGPVVKSQVTVDDQGYQNVMISFAPNVPSQDGKEIIEEIQDELQNMSSVLYKAIGIPIASATFLLPSSWPTETWEGITVSPASRWQAARKVDIRVDGIEDSPFTKQPVALQHGGCGVAGHQIILNLNYIGVFERHSEGQLLAREWLKYRYGVFEENGFMDDELYPAYYRIPGKSEIRIPECTNSKVKYIFKQTILREVCDMDKVELLNCRTDVDEISALNVTSSLMYFHKDLPRMQHICGKDGRPHNSLARNKQNALCNGRSIWDVVKSSDDFKKIQQQPANSVPKPIQFSYIKESKPRFVVLLENSDKFLENEIPSAIRFALRRLYYDLPPQSKFALYTYNSDVTEALTYTELPEKGRKDLGVIADFGSAAKSICTSCGIQKAAQSLLEKNGGETGSILLITASPLDKVPELSEKLRETGICLHVLRFTDESNYADQTYDALAKSFYCFSQESIHMSSDVVDIFHALSRYLKNTVMQFNDELGIKTIASGNMSAQLPVTIPRDQSALQYTLWLGRALEKDSIECKAGDTAVELKPDTAAADIASFTFSPVDGDITCKISSTKQPPVLTQVQMSTQKGHNFVFDAWIHDMSTEKEQLPILIYAKIYFCEYPVKYANVTLVVTLGNRQEVVKMLDNGRGDPDVTQHDGIYSGYFSTFLEAGDYQIKVIINDNNGLADIGKDTKSLVPEPCCGSDLVSENYPAPAFSMDKILMYTAKNKRPEDGYPPSKILDFQALIFKMSDTVILKWTAPGEGKAVKYTIKLFQNRNDALTKFDTAGRELNTSSMVPRETGEVEGFVIPFKDLDEDVTYYAAIRSQNEFDKPSEISNVAEFVPKQQKESTAGEPSSTPESSTGGGITNHDPPKSSNKTVAIVLGVLGGIAGLCILVFLGYYFLVKKPRRK